MNLPIKSNPLKSYYDVKKAMNQLLEPMLEKFEYHNTQFEYGSTGSRTSSRTAKFEGVSRPLWGLIPMTYGEGKSDVWKVYREAIKYGTDKNCKEYWGDIEDYDQKIVEVSAIGLALAMVPEAIYEPLEEKVKNNLVSWISQVNKCKTPDNNWRFFVVFVNLGLKKVTGNCDENRIEEELKAIEKFYLSDGWYSDGIREQRDYYVSFAMHFYGLIYAKLMEEKDPKRAEKYKNRSIKFAEDFMYWFSEDGDAIAYGRSLTYRFAQCAFWSALIFAEVDVLSLGRVKGIILRHLRYWFQQEIFDESGILTIGYKYQNLVMAEGYNAPGSPYWAMKAFFCLAVPENHKFWSVEEEAMPVLKNKIMQKHPHMIICRENPKHIAAFTAGQSAKFEPAHMDAKYEKFVYSNYFGFSVSKGNYNLEQGAFDNMLALSEDGTYFRPRHTSIIEEINEDYILSKWQPWHDVTIFTWLIAGLPWHVRIHKICTNRKLHTAEGGFAINREDCIGRKAKVIESKHTVFIEIHEDKNILSGIIDLLKTRSGRSIHAESNTNICYPRTYIPTLENEIGIGTTWLVSAVCGSVGTEKIDMNEIPTLINDNESSFEIIKIGQKKIYMDKISMKLYIINERNNGDEN